MQERMALALAVVMVLVAGGCAHSKEGSYKSRPPLNRVHPFLVATDEQGTMALYEKVEGFEDIGALAFEPSEDVRENLERDPFPPAIATVVECVTYTVSTTLADGRVLRTCGVHCSDGSNYPINCGADIFASGFDKDIVE